MRLAEQRVWDAMRKAAPSGFWVQRVENLVGEGIPDVHVMNAQGAMAWVELKAGKLPKRGTTRVLGGNGLRPSQINWHVKAASLGASVYTVLRVEGGELFMLHCTHAATINEMTAEELRAESIAGTWEEIYTELS